MYISKIKTKYRIISFFMSIVFVFSNIAQLFPFTVFGEEFEKLNFAWILNEESDNQEVTQNGKNSVWEVKVGSYVEMKANLNVFLNEDTERVTVTMPKSAYINSDKTSVDLDTEALGELYDASLNEEKGVYEITPKQVAANTELSINVVYKGYVKENASFDINANVMQNDESVKYFIHGSTKIIADDTNNKLTAIVKKAKAKNAEDPKITYTLKWNDLDSNDTNTWTFNTELYHNFQAALHIGGLQGKSTRKFAITLNKFLYNYRDGSVGPALDVKSLKDSGVTVTDNNDGTYTVEYTGDAQTMDFIFTYKNASIVKTKDNTKIDLPVDITITEGETTKYTHEDSLSGTIKTSISSVRPSKEYAGKVEENGQIKNWSPALQSSYGITQAQYDDMINACPEDKEIRFAEYCITADITGCQPYKAAIKENPENGEVIAVNDGNQRLKTTNADGYYTFDKEYNKNDANYKESPKIYVLVKYEIDKDVRKLHNEVKVKSVGIDGNTTVEESAQITHQWAIANIKYDKGIWGITKGYSRSNISGAIDILNKGGKKQFFYQAMGYSNTSRYLNNEEAFNAYKNSTDTKPTYRTEVMDDAMFIGKKDGTFVQLTDSDYTFTKCRVYLSFNKMTGSWNADKGEPELESPANVEYPYTNIGECADCITVNGKSIGKDVKTDTNGEQYIEVEVSGTTVNAVFTEKELGENRLRLNLYGEWKSNGSTFTTNRNAIFGTDEENIESIPVINWDAIHGYQQSGEEFWNSLGVTRTNGSWQNPTSQSCWYDSDTKAQMLEFDKKYSGHGEICSNVIVPEGSGEDSTNQPGYSQRAIITHNIYTAPTYGGAAKWVSNRQEPDDDKNAATMSYNLIAMQGGLAGFANDLDEMMNKKIMTSSKTAVFYDLLPKGMEYRSIEHLTGTQTVDTSTNGQFTWDFKDITNGEYKFVPTYESMKTVNGLKKYSSANVEVQDNYNDSGRQLLTITVTYANPPKAYFKGYNTSLFSLFFSAKINVRATDKSGKFNKSNYHNYVTAEFYDNENNPITIEDTPVTTSMLNAFPSLEKIITEPITDNGSKQTVVHADAVSGGNQNADASNILKSVKAINYDTEWKDSTYTDLGGTYQYRLLYNLNKGSSNNVVIFDTIEFDGTEWNKHGTFAGVARVELPSGLNNAENLANIEYWYYDGEATTEQRESFANGTTTGWTKDKFSNPNSVTIAVKFNNIDFSVANDNDYAAVYLNMTATDKWGDIGKKTYNSVSYYNVLEATGTGSHQLGNTVNIGVRGIEKPFSLTKNFVKDGSPKSYFGDVRFKLECTEPNDSKPKFVLNDDTEEKSDITYTMNFNGETTKKAVDFAKARITKPGTYTFKVTEIKGSDTEHVDYDTSAAYTITVTVAVAMEIQLELVGRGAVPDQIEQAILQLLLLKTPVFILIMFLKWLVKQTLIRMTKVYIELTFIYKNLLTVITLNLKKRLLLR